MKLRMIQVVLLGSLALAVVLPGCSGGSGGDRDGDSGITDGDGTGGEEGTDGGLQDGECAFPFAPPREHNLTFCSYDYTAYDLQILCSLNYQSLRAVILMVAEPTGEMLCHEYDVFYQAKTAYLCRDDEIVELGQDEIEYSAGHHGWDTMYVKVDDWIFAFGWSEVCDFCPDRPCIYPCRQSFDHFDVLAADDQSLLDEEQPTICVLLTARGNPRPLVPQVRVPPQGPEAGEYVRFDMGSDQGEADEKPVHAVDLSSAFRQDVYETTNAEFCMFLNDHGNDCEEHACVLTTGEGVRLQQVGNQWQVEAGFENHPVVQVTWYGATQYCHWRSGVQESRIKNDRLFLPTEAQWELAASGGGTSKYPWGVQDPTCELANYQDCGHGDTQEVCQHPDGKSRDGACDLSGNVAEWIRDWYSSGGYEVCTNACLDPTGPAEPTGNKVIRGGSFLDQPGALRSTDRKGADPEMSYKDVGFRCVGNSGTPRP